MDLANCPQHGMEPPFQVSEIGFRNKIKNTVREQSSGAGCDTEVLTRAGQVLSQEKQHRVAPHKWCCTGVEEEEWRSASPSHGLGLASLFPDKVAFASALSHLQLMGE